MSASQQSQQNAWRKDRYFNRELSWLSFNHRVLDQALNDEYPLLERLRYLGFSSSNLDEFFEIRVAGLLQEADSGLSEYSLDGRTPKEQLKEINKATRSLVTGQYECWQKHIVPGLRKEGIIFKNKSELDPEERTWLDSYFSKEIYPVLTPLALDFAHPFPQLTNKGLNILVQLEDPSTKDAENLILAIIPVPRILPRVIPIELTPGKHTCYIFLSDILRDYAAQLFPGYKLKGAWEFRITRNSDLYIDEEEVENLLYKIEEELYNMRRGAAVRLEINHAVAAEPLKKLLSLLKLKDEYIYLIDGPLNLMRLLSAYSTIDRPDLKFKPHAAYTPPGLNDPTQIFQNLRTEDYLLHHPYDSFSPVVDFIQQAAIDPKVFAIKQTLYRTSGESSIIEALKEASRNGKQVTALIELKARFDEALNIKWAKELEEEGVHVVYGITGLKTHCKCCLIVRQESNGLKRYAHLGTGNYNAKTAKTYTDLSLFTSNTEITDEVASLFNTLTGFARSPEFKHLLVAPFNLHSRLLDLIHNETDNAKKGLEAHIVLKLNSLADEHIINALYLASAAGVKIDIIVRSICCLIPGVESFSSNIHVRSILGRYLEHSRIYYFKNAQADPLLYIGSSDWMPRNFFRRIEVAFPIYCPKHRDYILKDLLPSYLKDNKHAQILQHNGEYQSPEINSEIFSTQESLLAQATGKSCEH